ncbi:MAG: hypothetical protein IKT76_06635 [Bacteroides sp.]|nr:hypothetical protein [Bacteroides sp.]
MTALFFVRKQGEPIEVQTQEGVSKRCSIELQAFGKKDFEASFVADLWGNDAGCRYYSGDLVVATLHFRVREHEGRSFQNVQVKEIRKVN